MKSEIVVSILAMLLLVFDLYLWHTAKQHPSKWRELFIIGSGIGVILFIIYQYNF